MDERTRLYRSTTDRKIAGVCGGLAEYFDIDPVLVRAVFVALALIGGLGLLLYVLLWIAVPRQPRQAGGGAMGQARSSAVSATKPAA
jgi:phage shock protein PspC (stress-responsive transcriptional regulator)